MAKNAKIEFIEDMEFSDPKLTRIDPNTKFVIDRKSGRVLYIFRIQEVNKMIQRLINKGIVDEISGIRKNGYGDLLIL